MSASVIRLRDRTGRRSAAFREQARQTHVEAVRRLEMGDRAGWLAGLREADRLTEQARALEQYEDECRATAAALDQVIEMVRGGMAS